MNPASTVSSALPGATACEQPLTAPLLVLDTNAILDWMVFDDPSMKTLASAIDQGRARWIACAAMRDEFDHVAGREWVRIRGADTYALGAKWNRLAVQQPAAPWCGLSCTDPDDQKFLDLALSAGARWLVSRDRALLRLARRAAPMGLSIVRPQDWRAE